MSQSKAAASESADKDRIRLVSTEQMAEDFGGSCLKTILRKAKSDPEFPKLALIGNRYFARADALENYKKNMLLRCLNKKPVKASAL